MAKTLVPFCVKINLGPFYDGPDTNYDDINNVLIAPIILYLEQKNKKNIQYLSIGIHDFNEGKGVPHIHINFLIDAYVKNPTANYKYFMKTLVPPYDKDHFKKCKHSIKHECYTPIACHDTDEGGDDLLKTLAYPLKECINRENMWKAPPISYCRYSPYTQPELLAYGAGLYRAATEKFKKKQKLEDSKLEKWCEFCAFMDEIRVDPQTGEPIPLTDLRTICEIALNHYRTLPQRTSVNAVITMCKDYAFKRNIWTNTEILNKYNII